MAVVARHLTNTNSNIWNDNMFFTVENPLIGWIDMNFLIDKGKELILMAKKGINAIKNPITNDGYDFCISAFIAAIKVPIANRLIQAININSKYAPPNVKL